MGDLQRTKSQLKERVILKLYEISNNLIVLQTMLDNAEDELDRKTAIDTLESVEFDFNEKVENIVKLIRNWEGEVTAIDAEKKRLANRSDNLKKNIDKLKEYMFTEMKKLEKNKVETGLFTVSVKKNPKKVVVLDLLEVPVDYLKFQEPTVDKKKIMQDINEGKEIAGIAIQQDESLTIK